MKKKLIPVIVVVTALLVSTLYFEFFRYMESDKSDIAASGTIEVTEIDIGSKIAGRVISLPKTEGADVSKGELVVKLEYDELSARRFSARANLINAKKNIERIKKLFKTGSVSRERLDNAETAYRVARAAYDQVSASIGNAVIYSPIDGVVLDTNLEIGEMAFPGTPVMTIADLTRPWIYIYVNETKLGLVKIGQAAILKIDTYPGREFKGKVVSISNKAEFTPKTIQTKDERIKLVFAVKVALENKEKVLKPGMPADVYINTGGEQQ